MTGGGTAEFSAGRKRDGWREVNKEGGMDQEVIVDENKMIGFLLAQTQIERDRGANGFQRFL